MQINGGDSTPDWVIQIAIVMANDLIDLVPLFLIGMWLWGNQSRRNLAIKACLVALLALGVNQAIGLIWQHPRPFMIGLGHIWIPHAADSSFPSDHMTVLASIGLTLLFGGAFRLAAAIWTAGIAVAWARVFLGVHFPLDMVGAVVVASAAHAVISPLWRKVGDAVTHTIEQMYRTVLAHPIAAGWIQR